MSYQSSILKVQLEIGGSMTSDSDNSKYNQILPRSIYLRKEDGSTACVAKLVDGDVHLENYWSGGSDGMSLEIIYSIRPHQFDLVANYFGYPKGLSIMTLLKSIDSDFKGLELWEACRDQKLPDIERFTWIS
jgi:hypothetical protein